MFKLHYQLNNDPEIVEQYTTYVLVSARIVELQDEFTSSTTFSVMIYDTSDNLIQGANKP